MGIAWGVFLVALACTHFGYGLPIGSTPQTYPYGGTKAEADAWSSYSGFYALVPAIGLLITAVGFLIGCTWCYRHKDRKVFAASGTQLGDGRRSQPPDSGFSEPALPVGEDNNNGPISLREMQNIANNNAAAYIVSENDERNRISRESLVEFEPLPAGIVADPLEQYADWFGDDNFPRNRLQYLREIGRGWFGRVVEGEIEGQNSGSNVAVKILNQNASLEDKARFLEEARLYRDVTHENVLGFIAKCVREDPWIMIFELIPMNLQQYLIANRNNMAALNEAGVPLRLLCDVTSALAYLHSRGLLYGVVWSEAVLVRGSGEGARAALGAHSAPAPPPHALPPETARDPTVHTFGSEVWGVGGVAWQVCARGRTPPAWPAPPPDLPPCLYRAHLYQVIQLCWHDNPESRPTASQVHALINHLYINRSSRGGSNDDGYGSSDFEDRWQRLKPNSIPIVDEHVAIIHAPSTSTASHFTGSDQELHNQPITQDSLSIDIDTAVSRSSSIMSDKDPLSLQLKSESLTNLHGSLEDVRNIYLTHNEMAVLECHQGNIAFDDIREREQDRSDSSMDPWLKDIIAGSQDDVSYYKDVSDVIKNLDNILNSEKTSSSESSHQASPSRDNLSLDCKKDYPIQSTIVKSPGITNFQNIVESGFDCKTPENETCEDDEVDRDTLGTLSHSFERHSDTLSQQTLENITPETPIKDLVIENKIYERDSFKEVSEKIDTEVKITVPEETKLPKLNNVVSSNIPKLMDLCVASIPSISETKSEITNEIQDCLRSCDNNLAVDRTDDEKIETKSIDVIVNIETHVAEMLIDEYNNIEMKEDNNLVTLPEINENEATIYSHKDYLGTASYDSSSLKSNEQEVVDDISNNLVRDKKEVPTPDSNSNYVEDEIVLDVNESQKSINEQNIIIEQEDDTTDVTDVTIQVCDETETIAPEAVQKVINNVETAIPISHELNNKSTDENLFRDTPDKVQNLINETPIVSEIETLDKSGYVTKNNLLIQKSTIVFNSNDSTVYLDLTNNTQYEKINNYPIDENVKDVIQSCLESSDTDDICTLVKNESTIYMDLPSLINDTNTFLHSERLNSVHNNESKYFTASTPVGNEQAKQETIHNSIRNENEEILEKPKLDYELESSDKRNCVPDNSPFESPTKSHQTDTYDENSSVVLGPFENYHLESYRSAKPEDLVDLPKEELLAFSSNFSEINLETPSPLCDGRFLNEVPDIVHDEMQFDDILTVSEMKVEQCETKTESNSNESVCHSGTEKRVSPLTPPNSPGNLLASTSQQNYVVDIYLDNSAGPSNMKEENIFKDVDLNKIELQITTKMAMAENENNMNIEHCGPLNLDEGLEDPMLLPDSLSEEAYLAGNESSPRNIVDLDDESVQALRNELELKLPLAQVSNIEPGEEEVWDGALPPPPELVLGFPAALSPIQEETRLQLSAYENDAPWSASGRSVSSESYPEPPSAADRTYTLRRELSSAPEVTMSLDSLNGSPHKKPSIDSAIDDKTYTKNDDDKESKCERISQVSPYIMSPTTDTSAPENSDYVDNPTGVSTLSKTTVPTDAKSSKPSETQCLSKATSIDSWCSNDTLYNVEENFDDLAMDPDPVQEFESEKEDHSDSSRTLTHHDDDKDLSHCSTYILHDSKSDACDTFSPDSITANDNYTYTKAKTDVIGTTPPYITKSDLDSTKNTQTKDLAYGTLMSGLPSFSNCTSEVASAFDDIWKMKQPELVRRSPITTEVSNLTPPQFVEEKEFVNISGPNLTGQHCMTKMDSTEISYLKENLMDSQNISEDSNLPQFNEDQEFVNISGSYLTNQPSMTKTDSAKTSCLKDNLRDSQNKSEESESQMIEADVSESPNSRYKSMAPSVTSTPINELQAGNQEVEALSLKLPDVSDTRTPEFIVNHIPNFQTFAQSAELRPQDKSPFDRTNSQDTEILLEGESKTLSRTSNRDSLAVNDRTPNYSDFENSALSKPQDVHSSDKSSQSVESAMNSEEFRHFENSVKSRPQDLSSMIDASSLLLNSERLFSAITNSSNLDFKQTSQLESRENVIDTTKSLDIIPPNDTNLIESQNIVKFTSPSNFYSNLDVEEETEQPHSIIITEKDMLYRESPNRTYDSHTETPHVNMNNTYDSHAGRKRQSGKDDTESFDDNRPNVIVNGVSSDVNDPKSNSTIAPKTDDDVANLDSTKALEDYENVNQNVASIRDTNEANNQNINDNNDLKCNGNSTKYATINFLNENFEELIESNVDDGDVRDVPNDIDDTSQNVQNEVVTFTNAHDFSKEQNTLEESEGSELPKNSNTNGFHDSDEEKLTSVTENFLENEKKFCQLDSCLPLLNDIRFTGPASEIMSTSFNQDSPTEPTSPDGEQNNKPDIAADILKEWDSDSESHSSNSSSGEFIWKGGDGRETALVSTAHFDHQRSNGGGSANAVEGGAECESGSGESGSEGDEVEFVPSSWDCRAEPAKSSLRTLQQNTPDNKKRVVFKRQKYHCVYEYPREAEDTPSAFHPDFSTYADWDSTNAEDAELGYGQLFGVPNPLDMYPLRSGIAFDYDEDFFISSSTRPFESLGIMSTTSQFFPGMHVKNSILERELSDDFTEEFPPPPSPLPTATLIQTRTPSLDFTTPDSGVEDITPGSTSTEDDFKAKKSPEAEVQPCWRPVDSGSSSESVSPSSPGEALGGLRHTRDKLKLDLPPSPHIPSPRHNRVFNFVLDKPKRHRIAEEKPAETGSTPLVMTDETPIVSTALPLSKDEELPLPEPTFSTFGKNVQKIEPEQKSIILTDEVVQEETDNEVKVESPKVLEAVRGEGTVLDSGDEDSGIESSSKATLERKNTPNVS